MSKTIMLGTSPEPVYSTCFSNRFCIKNKVDISAAPNPMVTININVWLLGRYKLEMPCRSEKLQFLGKNLRTPPDRVEWGDDDLWGWLILFNVWHVPHKFKHVFAHVLLQDCLKLGVPVVLQDMFEWVWILALSDWTILLEHILDIDVLLCFESQIQEQFLS